jgi:hypothetical protein
MKTTSTWDSRRDWVVGFTGHRKLPNPETISRAIASAFQNVRDHASGNVTAISSIASGGDTLFAQQALKAGLRWVALLPFPRAEFRKDFDESEWQAAEDCLSRAIAEEVWSPTANRPDAYWELGIATVDRSDILFAAWDGAPARGRGGTAEIVAHARDCEKPLVWIHSDSGRVSRENWPTSG